MAATCGVGLNNAMASGVNVLGDSHGGAGQQCVELLTEIREPSDGRRAGRRRRRVLADWRARSRYLPGFGHRFHPVDPRRDPLLSLVDERRRGRRRRRATTCAPRWRWSGLTGCAPVPMNIDGATAVIYAELGFAAAAGPRAVRAQPRVGILAHAWEETQQGRRNKGPIPPSILPAYLGQPGAPGAGG